jgi:putative membrane protein
MLKRLLANALVMALVTWLVPGMTWTDPTSVRGIITIIGVALLFGVVNAIIRPFFKVLSGCMILLTLGLFIFVINAAMVWLTSWICGYFGIGWGVDSFFPTALIAAIAISVVSFVVTKFIN